MHLLATYSHTHASMHASTRTRRRRTRPHTEQRNKHPPSLPELGLCFPPLWPNEWPPRGGTHMHACMRECRTKHAQLHVHFCAHWPRVLTIIAATDCDRDPAGKRIDQHKQSPKTPSSLPCPNKYSNPTKHYATCNILAIITGEGSGDTSVPHVRQRKKADRPGSGLANYSHPQNLELRPGHNLELSVYPTVTGSSLRLSCIEHAAQLFFLASSTSLSIPGNTDPPP